MRLACCVLAFSMMVMTAGQVVAAPAIDFAMTTFDFGEVYQGESVRHVFRFKNSGDETLEIDKVRSSCGCTAVLVSEKSISADGQGEIQANFDSTRFRGAISKTIYVYSNDPAKPIVNLYIKGKVLEVVAVEPSQVNFGRVDADQSLAAKVTLRNQAEEPMSFGKPTTTAEELQAKMPEVTLAKGEEATVELILSPKPGQKRFSGYILIPAVGMPKDQLRIPVYANFQ